MISSILLIGFGWAGLCSLHALTTVQSDQLDELEQRVSREPALAIETAEELVIQNASDAEFSGRLLALVASAELQRGDFEAANAAALQAINDFGTDLSPSLQAELLGMRAALPWRQGNLADALGLMLQAYRLVETDGEATTVARTANRLGVLYSNLGRLDEALKYYQVALELDRAHQAPLPNIASTLGNMGLLYHLLENYEEAERYQSESVALFAEAEDPFGRARNQTNLAITRSKLDQPETAIDTINQSLATFEELGEVRGQTSALLGRATILNTLGRSAESLASIEQVMPLLHAEQAKGEIAEAKIIRARALLHLERLEEAWDVAREAVALASEIEASDAIINGYDLLAKIQENRGEFAAALDAERAAAVAREEKLDARSRDLIAVLEIEYATAERERALADLRARNAEQALNLQQEQTRLRNAVGGIGVSLLVVIGLFYGYRTKTKYARELQSANTQLADLNAEKSALMDIASHDLRGRLATIRWQAEARVFHDGDKLEPTIKADFTAIADAAGMMHHKVSRLLDAQRADSLEPLGPPQSVDLSRWLSERTDSFAVAAENKSIEIQLDRPETLNATTHPDELAIIVDNLIDNALKYSPVGALVTVSLSIQDQQPRLAVIDRGPGIPAEEQPRLFDKFQKLSAEPTAGEDSTGLGLAIVKRLCDRLGITIKVDSTPGEGARFELTLPA